MRRLLTHPDKLWLLVDFIMDCFLYVRPAINAMNFWLSSRDFPLPFPMHSNPLFNSYDLIAAIQYDFFAGLVDIF
jgi:hypothetical protein